MKWRVEQQENLTLRQEQVERLIVTKIDGRDSAGGIRVRGGRFIVPRRSF